MFEQAFRNIDDILRKEAGCTTELDYTEQSSWLLFLKYLDGLEADKATEAALDGKKYTHILDQPYRWGDLGRAQGPCRQTRPPRGPYRPRPPQPQRGAPIPAQGSALGTSPNATSKP